jgi:hypothetical protein
VDWRLEAKTGEERRKKERKNERKKEEIEQRHSDPLMRQERASLVGRLLYPSQQNQLPTATPFSVRYILILSRHNHMSPKLSESLSTY